MSTVIPDHRPHLAAQLRRDDRVSPLELFFDLVFVLALIQCTELMTAEPTWTGLGRGLLVLALMWWAWTGFSWVTSLVNPDAPLARFVMFSGTASLVVVALCIPEAYGGERLLFALAYSVALIVMLGLFWVASANDRDLRRSIVGLVVGNVTCLVLLVAGAFLHGWGQTAAWMLALIPGVGGPYVFGSRGWHLVPGHFAERHGLIIIIALGESIVSIGVGAQHRLDAGAVVAAVLGVAVAAALWWLYFDVVAQVAHRRLSTSAPGREQNEIARDSYTYLHFPMIAGIVLVAVGLKKALSHVDAPLDPAPAAALLGGGAIYLLAHTAFRWRTMHRFSTQRVVAAALLVLLYPLARHLDALVTQALVVAVLAVLIAYETRRFRDQRSRLQRQLDEHVTAVPEIDAVPLTP